MAVGGGVTGSLPGPGPWEKGRGHQQQRPQSRGDTAHKRLRMGEPGQWVETPSSASGWTDAVGGALRCTCPCPRPPHQAEDPGGPLGARSSAQSLKQRKVPPAHPGTGGEKRSLPGGSSSPQSLLWAQRLHKRVDGGRRERTDPRAGPACQEPPASPLCLRPAQPPSFPPSAA